MELIFIPNSSLLYLYSNDINSLKKIFLKKLLWLYGKSIAKLDEDSGRQSENRWGIGWWEEYLLLRRKYELESVVGSLLMEGED